VVVCVMHFVDVLLWVFVGACDWLILSIKRPVFQSLTHAEMMTMFVRIADV